MIGLVHMNIYARHKGFAPMAVLIVMAVFAIGFGVAYVRQQAEPTIEAVFTIPVQEAPTIAPSNQPPIALPNQIITKVEVSKETPPPAPVPAPAPVPQIKEIKTKPEETIVPKSTNNAVPLKVIYEHQESILTASGAFAWTNTNRKNNGLPALVLDAKLTAAANTKLADMFDKQYFAHVSPTGITPSQVVKSSGYMYITTGENLAWGNFDNDEDLLTAWMNSPGHRANILHTSYTEIGIAVGKGMYEGREVWMAVQEFGLPASVCPEPSQILKNQIIEKQSALTQSHDLLMQEKNMLENGNPSTDAEYNKKVDAYNEHVAQYNAEVEQTKKLVADYNAQVNAHTACRAAYAK